MRFICALRQNSVWIVSLCRSEPASGSLQIQICWRSHSDLLRDMFVILNELKNLINNCLRSFADAQDDNSRRAECASLAHSANAADGEVSLSAKFIIRRAECASFAHSAKFIIRRAECTSFVHSANQASNVSE